MKLFPFVFLWSSLQRNSNIFGLYLASTRVRWFFLFSFTLAAFEVAHGQNTDINRQLTLDISLGALYSTSSLWAEGLAKPTASPFVDINLERERFFASLTRGIGYDIVRTGQFRAGAALGYRAGRRENEGTHYRGLGNIKGAPLALVLLDWEPNEILYLYASASRAINGSTGSSLIAGASVGFPIAGRLNGYADASGLWGDDYYAKTYYGITPDQATHSGYRAYIPGAGLVSTMVLVGFIYEVSTKWSANFTVGATRFEGDVLKSPLIDKRTQPIANFYVTHIFM